MFDMKQMHNGILTELDFSKMTSQEVARAIKRGEVSVELKPMLNADAFFSKHQVNYVVKFDPLVLGGEEEAGALADKIKETSELAKNFAIPKKDADAFAKIVADGNYSSRKFLRLMDKYPEQIANWRVNADNCVSTVDNILQRGEIITGNKIRGSFVGSLTSMSNAKGVRIYPAKDIITKSATSNEMCNSIIHEAILEDVVNAEKSSIAGFVHRSMFKSDKMIDGVTKYINSDFYPQCFSVVSQGLKVVENMNEEYESGHVKNPETYYYEQVHDYECVDSVEENKAQEEYMTYPAVCSVPEAE